MRRRIPLHAAVALTVAALAACSDVLGPETSRVLGTIAFDGSFPFVFAPDTVEAGKPFTVMVHTEWPNGCASLEETEVRASATEVHVIPWDRVSEDEECPDALERMNHTVTMSRASPAVLDLVVHGRRLQGGERVEIQVTRKLVVRAP